MVKLTFKTHDNKETKEVRGFSWSMLPNGSYSVNKGCLEKREIISALRYYLAKVEEE